MLRLFLDGQSFWFFTLTKKHFWDCSKNNTHTLCDRETTLFKSSKSALFFYFHKSIDNEIVEMYFDKNLMGFVVADDWSSSISKT